MPRQRSRPRTMRQQLGTVLFSTTTLGFLQKFGVSFVRTKESPIPLLSDLPDVWRAKSELPGIDFNESTQISMLDVFARFMPECDFPRTSSIPYEFCVPNDSFGFVSAAVLHSMIREYKPRSIIEVGSGNSTLVSARAVDMNHAEGHSATLTAVEPYPKDVILRGFPGLTRLVKSRAQDVAIDLFLGLNENDVLFIDGSHYVKTLGDVVFLFLDVIPRLRRGVLIHVHDIFFPYDYPIPWLREAGTFYSEQYLLQALLCCNSKIEIVWAEKYMKTNYAERIDHVFRRTTYADNHESNSFWMRKL